MNEQYSAALLLLVTGSEYITAENALLLVGIVFVLPDVDTPFD
jgi:hypothetical protein